MALSNYCAANAFLDNFARFRLSQGLPAVSLALGVIDDIGYLYEHRDIANIMLSKGVLPLEEGEMLQLIDMSLSQGRVQQQQMKESGDYDPLASSHLLTGFELSGVTELRNKGHDSISLWTEDPRSLLIARELEVSAVHNSSKAGSAGLQGVERLLDAGDPAGAQSALCTLVARKVSRLLMLEDMDFEQSLSSFGFDSILAAELRTFMFQMAEVDVSFAMVMAPTTSITGLANAILKHLEAKRQAEVPK